MLTKKKEIKFKINGLIQKARWENIACKCNKSDIKLMYPLIECDHCKFQERWDSVPQKDFQVTYIKNKKREKATKTIKEITLVRGSKYQDVIGWLQ